MEPVEEIILRLLEPVGVLKRLPRTGWLLAGVPHVESVAEHTFATALLAFYLAGYVNQNPGAQGLTGPLEVGRVLAIALVHDLAEGALTDLPRRATQLLGEEAKHTAEALALTQMFEAVEGGAYYQALWQEYAGAATPEARLVRDADKLEMIQQALWYEQTGQRNLREFWEGHHWHYPICDQVYKALRRQRDRSS